MRKIAPNLGIPDTLPQATDDDSKRSAELQKVLDEIRRVSQGFVTSKYIEYQEFIPRFRHLLQAELPPDAIVLVVSKGDGELLKLGGRRVWHFPQAEDGTYSGFYPPNSSVAIGHLESLRAKGAAFLVFPSTAFWWFQFYGDFSRHLESHYPIAIRQDETCVVYALHAQLNGRHADCAHREEVTRDNATFVLTAKPSDEACEALRQSLQLDPDNPQLLIDSALIDAARGKMDRAEQFAAKALAKAPDDYRINFESARLAWQQGKLAIVEQRLGHLLQLFPSDTAAEIEFVKLLCSQIENRSAVRERAPVERLVSHLADPARSQWLTPELHLRVTESLGSWGETKLAMASLQEALRQFDFTSEILRMFVLRLLRPAVSDSSFIPFDDPRALVMFLTHVGNGFAAVQHSYKAITCYHLAAAASDESFAADFNLAFRALADADPLAVMENLRRTCRVYSDDAAQICWPTQNGHVWPSCGFDLSAQFEALKPSTIPWPKITVITPSYNQAAYVEDTILSVLNQHYPRLEYIVVDGGSTDGAVDILRRYEPSLTQLIVEPDGGQTDAINKGLRLSTGDLITWLNSDDLLGPGALFAVALAYINEQTDLIAGFCLEHSGERSFGLISLPAVTPATFNVECLGDLFDYWLKGHYFYQPEVVFTRRILEKAGSALETSLNYTMDYEFWLRCADAGAQVSVIRWPVGMFRRHEAQKTANMDATVIEQGQVRDKFLVPQPGMDRTLDIRHGIGRALSRNMPRIAVISTRAGKIFSPEIAGEVRKTFAADGLQVEFQSEANPTAMAEADLIILLVHLHKERAAVRQLRESGCNVPLLGWFWDNHHHVFNNHKAVSDLDVCIPGHGFAAAYLRSQHALMTPVVPLCVTQWSEDEGRRYFDAYSREDRSDMLYGGFVRYECATKRNVLIEQLISSGNNGVYFLDEHDLCRYFGMSLDERFRQWATHKVSLCLPLAGDLSQRLFDALLTGQIPIVPSDMYDLDTVISPTVQSQLPIVRFDKYSLDDVIKAHAKARQLFDNMGFAGILRRHQFALENHMFVSRLRAIISSARDLAYA